MAFDLLEETLQRTNLKDLAPGKKVNLERSLLADGRIGGHFVQGHVDAAIPVAALLKQGSDLRIDFKVPPDFAAYVAFKGSVAINGVSLTIAEVTDDSFAVWIIPHTASHTNLGYLKQGDLVNLECDMLAKYTARIMQMRGI
jgi:riboflavin synthase